MSSWENIYASFSNYDNEQVEEQAAATAEEKDETLQNQEDNQAEVEEDQAEEREDAAVYDQGEDQAETEEDQAEEEAAEDYDVGWYDPPNQDEDEVVQQEEAPVPRDTNGHCNLCKRDFDNLSVVLQHQKSHRGEKDKCPLCQRKFSSKSTLIMHADNQHNRRLR